MAGKKNKKGSGDNPKENKPPNDNKGQGSGSGSQQGGSGNNPPAEKKKESAQQQGGQGGQQRPQQGGGGKGPQQQGGQGGQGGQQRPQQGGGGPQQQGGWANKGQQQQGGPSQQGGQQGGRPQQGGGGPQQQGAWQQQGGGGPQQQGGWANKGQQQQGGPPQQGGQQGGRPQQGGGGPQQQGALQQQGGGGPQQQGGWANKGQQQQGGPPQQGGQQGGRPQQGGGGPQQQGAWQQQGGGGPQQQGGWANKGQQQHGGQQQQGGQQQGGRPQQGGGGPQQQGGWANKGQQQHGGGGGGRDQYRDRDQSQQSHGSQGSDGQQRQQYEQRDGGRGGGRGGGGGGGRGGGQFRDRQQSGYQQGGPQQGGSQQGGYQQRGPQQGGYQQRGPQQGGYQQRGPQQSSGPADNSIVRVPKPPTNNNIQRGTRGYKFEVETNYLLLNLDKMPDVAYHYDVKIDPDRPKKFLRPAFDAFVRKVFPDCDLAYDGTANAYSPVLLPNDKLGSEITVEVDEKGRKIPFKVTLKATDDIEIDLKSLKASNYHKERIFDKPMRALQCIEVVLSSPCHKIGVRAGRSFFKQPTNKVDLGDGFELWYGLYQAAMLCDQPLLNVDVSHKSFPSRVNLVEFYERLRYPDARALTEFLKGLRVTYKPPACFKSVDKDFKFVKVMDASNKQTFKTDDGKQQTIEQYYQSKGYRLQKPNLPCLHVGSTVKNIYLPLELLEVPPGQAIMRKDNENQVRQMIRYAATSTGVRKQKIMDLLSSFQFYKYPTVERFGVSVGRQFITVDARLLSSPSIEYGKGRQINIDRPGEWMNRGVGFYKCDNKIIHQWAIINISQKSDINALFLKEHFIEKIGREAGRLGMSLNSQCSDIKEISGGRGPVSIMDQLRKYKTAKISIVFVILPFHAESYAKVKQEAELSVGIVTQCIKGDTIKSYNKKFNQDKIIDQMTIGNILLKVNAKLNGINHKIAATNEISLQKSKVMFVGADVSHPSPLQTNLPSIVGVVASHDLNGTQYNMQYRLQTAKEETIQDMKNIMTQHLNAFKTFTGYLPDNIVYYRDGVSDGQFEIIKRKEVNDMRAACAAMKIKPKFTVIIVVKRHHTRFFPKQSDAEGKYDNVKAGTIVDQTICHPNEVQFFLVSHKAIQGTSKPTRYNVIIDEANINIDDLQAMTYNLCHLFPRCNRSVSYPAPAYLAHLVGLRGRAYIEGSNLNLENNTTIQREYNKRVVSKDVMNFNPMYFV